MPFVELEQGTDEWKELRLSKIGGSDIAKIMGVSPYGTAYTLWQEKVGLVTIQETSAMRMGTETEEQIRSWYEKKTMDCYFPRVIISETHSFAMASLDGLSVDGKRILECKYCNKEVFKQVQDGQIPIHYLYQCQWQLLCTPSAEGVHFICYNKALDDYACAIIQRDEKIIQDCVDKAQIFYENHIKTEIPPELSEDDYVIIDDETALILSEKLDSVMSVLSHLKKEEESLRQSLFSYSDDGNFICGNLKASRCRGKKTFDYKKACEDNNINMTKYEKKSIGFWRVSKISKEDEANDF
ncbi:MAG: hypothetical protein GKC08_03000 [Methanosarcinales archaeon]|nr:hypothetical protein [Methanosarcinales archaeon]